VIAVVLAVASAQELPPSEEPERADLASEEIIVYGEQRVAQARQAVVAELSELGYGAEVVDRGDFVVYRNEDAWKGEVVLHDDGWVRVKRQPLRVEGRQMPWARLNSPGAWAGCFVWPWLCVRWTGATLSHRRWMGVEKRTTTEIDPQVRELGDRVADLAVAHTVQDLPAQLEALWTNGTPLSGEGTLATYEERRAALLDYWGSRTDTVWGDEVKRAVEAFVYGVVQSSDHPFTTEELDAFDAAHPGTPFPRR
jgi:hypothetical protein